MKYLRSLTIISIRFWKSLRLNYRMKVINFSSKKIQTKDTTQKLKYVLYKLLQNPCWLTWEIIPNKLDLTVNWISTTTINNKKIIQWFINII